MSQRDDVQSQMNQTQSQMDDTQLQLNAVNAQLGEIELAKREIAEIKANFQEKRGELINMNANDADYWSGVQSYNFSVYYQHSMRDLKTYYNGLDAMADDLVRAECRLLNESLSLEGNLNILRQAWNWLKSEWEALIN